MPDTDLFPGSWGPEACSACGVAMPPGLVKLGRTRHVDCEEARRAWLELQAIGKAPRMKPAR